MGRKVERLKAGGHTVNLRRFEQILETGLRRCGWSIEEIPEDHLVASYLLELGVDSHDFLK